MGLDYRHGLSILDVIVYIPTLFMSLWMVVQHGFHKSAGWIFFAIFSLVQIVGACCYLNTISNPTSEDLYIAWAICTSIGLSPLTQGCFSLLSRANDSIQRNNGRAINPFIFKITHLVFLIAPILSIVGTTQQSSDNANFTQSMSNPKTQASMILFLIAWLCLCILSALLAMRREDIEDGEKRLLVAVGISLPLLLVRIAYSLVYVFGNNPDFNMFTGSVTIMLVMVVIEQIIVVVICLAIGLTLEKREPLPDPEAAPNAHPSYYMHVPGGQGHHEQDPGLGYPPKSRRGRGGFPRRGLIGTLVGLVVERVEERRR